MSVETLDTSSLEGIVGSWIYTFLILPILFVAIRTFKMETRASVIETQMLAKADQIDLAKIAEIQTFNLKIVDKLCKTQDKLANEYQTLNVNFSAVASKIDTFIDLHNNHK